MGKNYIESSLKRYLKRKVKITFALVISFLITGTVLFAEGENLKGNESKKKVKNISTEKLLKEVLEEIKLKSIHIIQNTDKPYGQEQIIGKDYFGNDNGIRIGINNGIIDFNDIRGQLIYMEVLGINNGTILNSGNGQNIDESGLGINNGTILSDTGQNISNGSLGINNGVISNGKSNGQTIWKGIGINNSIISNDGVGGQSASSGAGAINNGIISNSGNMGQRISGGGLGINYGIISNGKNFGQDIKRDSLGINNGVIANKGDKGQNVSTDGLGINNGIIINDSAYSSDGNGTFYKNGIALKRVGDKLVLNNKIFINSGEAKKFNRDVNILGKNELTDKTFSEIVEELKNNSATDKPNPKNIFINNLGVNEQGVDDENTKNNQLIIDTDLKGEFANTHITTAVTENEYTDEAVIKLFGNSLGNQFLMDKSTIVGYFEKDGTLIDMTELKPLYESVMIALDNSVISALGKENIKPTAIKFGKENNLVFLYNSTVIGKMDFSAGKNNVLNLNAVYNGMEKEKYADGTQFMTSVSDVSFGTGNDTINIEIQKGTEDETNKTGKGFVSLGKVDFGGGDDTLSFSFEDYKSGHFTISGEKEIGADGKITKHHGIDFGAGDNDRIKFSDVLDMEKYTELDGKTPAADGTDIERNIVMLNNLLNNGSMPIENLETLELADGDGNIFYFDVISQDQNGKPVTLTFDFKGKVLGGNGEDIFVVNEKLTAGGIDGGNGKDTLTLGAIKSSAEDSTVIDLKGSILNIEKININNDVKFDSSLVLNNAETVIQIHNGSIILGVDYGEKDNEGKVTGHALYDNGIKVDNSTGKVIIDTAKANVGTIISLGTAGNKTQFTSTDKEHLLESGSSNHHIEMIDGDIVIKVNEHIMGDSETGAIKYAHLDKIYQSIVSADKIKEMAETTTLSDKTKDEAVKAQLEFYGKIYHSTPYAYSNDVSKKSADLITESIMNLKVMPEYKQWIFGGSIAGQEADSHNNFYGKNLHKVDIGKNEISADTNIYGAYAFGKYGIEKNKSVGFALAGIRSDTDISGNSKLEGDGIYVSAFAEQEMNNLKLLAGISYQHSFYDSTRNVSNDYQSMKVDKKYEDDLISVFAGGKYSYHLGNNFFAEPNVKLSVTHIMQDKINEGDNGLTIETDKKDFTFVEGEVGIDLVKKINLSKGTLNLRAGTSLVYSIDGHEEEYLTGRITGSSKDFEMISPEDDRAKVKITVGTEYEMTNGMFMNLYGNYTTSSHTEDYAVSFGAGYKF